MCMSHRELMERVETAEGQAHREDGAAKSIASTANHMLDESGRDVSNEVNEENASLRS